MIKRNIGEQLVAVEGIPTFSGTPFHGRRWAGNNIAFLLGIGCSTVFHGASFIFRRISTFNANLGPTSACGNYFPRRPLSAFRMIRLNSAKRVFSSWTVRQRFCPAFAIASLTQESLKRCSTFFKQSSLSVNTIASIPGVNNSSMFPFQSVRRQEPTPVASYIRRLEAKNVRGVGMHIKNDLGIFKCLQHVTPEHCRAA